MEFVNTPGQTRSLAPQGIALIATAKDSTGTYFNPDNCSVSYGRDANGNITTETASDGVHIWVKTYTWTAGVLVAESKWVKQ